MVIYNVYIIIVMDGKTLEVLNQYGEVRIDFLSLCKKPDLVAHFVLKHKTVLEVRGSPVKIRVIENLNVLDAGEDAFPIWITQKSLRYWLEENGTEEMFKNVETFVRTLFEDSIGWHNEIDEFIDKPN
jgi:hypothetical protein